MVRSSNSKSTKEKKITNSKPAATKSKAASEKSAAATKATRVKSAKSETSAAAQSAAKTSKKSSTATKTKVTTEKTAKSAVETSVKATSASTASVRPKTSSKKAESAGKLKSKAPTPRTPELFEGLAGEPDLPAVSILPAISDPRADAEQTAAELNMPPEFRESPIHEFDETSPDTVVSKPAVPEPDVEVTFSYLGFNDQILEAIRKQNFHKPTRVQALCLPHTLDGKDVAGFAQTGTGKTAVYLLSAAHKLLNQENRVVNPHKPQVLVIVPTRELADQVSQDARKLLATLKLKTAAMFGGVDVERHVNELNQPLDIVVATPGRLLDLHRSKHLEFDDLQMLVIDECDRMFDMGFVDDVEYVLRHLPAERVQKLLFSATGSEKVKELAFEYLENPEYIETDPVRITPEKISQVAYAVTAEEKFLTLMGHLRAHNPECAIVFTNTKVVAEWIGYKLACNGLNVEVLTGDLPQRKRMSLIKKIKEGKCNLLVATDVLSRGLHVANLSHVYNFDIPDDAESFIHRIGRTARAGATGHAITLICDDYGYNMGAVEKLLGFNIPLAPVPQAFLNAEDRSDYPFDETGRVKVFGQTSTAPTGEERREREPRREREHEQPRQQVPASELPQAVKSGRPEPTLPHPKRDAHGARPTPTTPAPQRSADGPTPLREQPAAAAAAVAPSPAADQQGRPQHRGQRPAQGGHAGTQPGQTPKSGLHGAGGHAAAHAQRAPHAPQPQAMGGAATSGLPRRDDKARETIEMAIQAAKKAASKRQGTPATASDTRAAAKPQRSKVTTQIDEIAAAVLTTAQERLGGTFGHLQDRFVNRLEENFPRLSETLIRLGFFSKRFTDDR